MSQDMIPYDFPSSERAIEIITGVMALKGRWSYVYIDHIDHARWNSLETYGADWKTMALYPLDVLQSQMPF